MKKSTIALAAAAFLMLGPTACKTSEKNYRKSYDKIVEKIQSERTAEDSLLTGDFYTQGRLKRYVVGADTLTARIDYVHPDRISPSDTTPLPRLEPFYIIVGQFRQIFNARAMSQRLIRHGHSPVILHNNVPEYFVGLYPTSMAVDALRSLREVSTDTSVIMRPPCPWVLRPAQTVR